MKKHLISLMLGLGAVLGGCAKKAPPTAAQPLPAESFRQLWTVDLQSTADSLRNVFISGDTLLIYTASNYAYALDARSGQILYANAIAPASVTLHPPVVLSGYVVFPTTTTLEIFNRKGKKLSSIDLAAAIRSRAVGFDNNLFLGVDSLGGNSRLLQVRLNKQSNPFGWELLARGTFTAAPATFEKMIFAADTSGRLYAATEDRHPVWSTAGFVFLTSGPIVADLNVDDTGVYAASMDSKLYCIERLTGKVRWQYFAGRPLSTSPLLTASSVYQHVPEVGMVALDKNSDQHDRNPRWVASDVQQVLTDDDKYTYVRLADNRLAALDKKTGQVVFTSTRNDFVAFAANPKGRTIYALTTKNAVIAIQPVTTSSALGELVMHNGSTPGSVLMR